MAGEDTPKTGGGGAFGLFKFNGGAAHPAAKPEIEAPAVVLSAADNRAAEVAEHKRRAAEDTAEKKKNAVEAAAEKKRAAKETATEKRRSAKEAAAKKR